jgi:MFS family permease
LAEILPSEVAVAPPGEVISDASRRRAWGLCWTMFIVTTLNYMDRQAISLVNAPLSQEFGLRNEGFGWVLGAFLLTYALFQLPAGYLADRWDIRRLYAGAVVWWSLAAIGVIFSPTLGFLLACRALLGLGESFNWPCALRTTAMILPRTDRGLGNGIFNSGAAIGAVITPLIVAPLTEVFGWRVAFAVVGSLGFVWVAFWLALVGWSRASGRGGPLARLTLGVFGLMAVVTTSPVVYYGIRYALGQIGRFEGTLSRMALGGTLLVGLVLLMGFTPWFAWVTLRLAILGFDRPGWLNDGGRMLEPEDPSTSTHGLPATTKLAFGGLALASLLVAIIGVPWYGRSAIWWGIALAMVGLLLVARLLPQQALQGADWAESVGQIVRLPRFWVLVAVSISINICWHFLVGWLPSYYQQDRKMVYLVSALLSAVTFLAADVGNLGGGLLARLLAGRGLGPTRARMVVMQGCTALISVGAWVGLIESDALTIILLGLMALGTAAFMANYFAFCQEVSVQHTGLIVGILGGLGNLFAAGFAPLAGRIKDTTGGFGPVFVIVGLLPLIGLGALMLGWGRDVAEPKPS